MPSVPFRKLLNRLIALLAPLAVLAQQPCGNTPDLKTRVLASSVAPVFRFIAQAAYLARESVPVDLSKVGPALVDIGGLQRLPAALCAVLRHVSGYGVGVKQRIELAAGVVVVDGDHEIAGRTVFVGPLLTHTGR